EARARPRRVAPGGKRCDLSVGGWEEEARKTEEEEGEEEGLGTYREREAGGAGEGEGGGEEARGEDLGGAG
ncbi:hypothetical protein GW17_00062407, partial [Ensete ventricosum]